MAALLVMQVVVPFGTTRGEGGNLAEVVTIIRYFQYVSSVADCTLTNKMEVTTIYEEACS